MRASTIEDNASSSMAGMLPSVLDVTAYDGFRRALDAVLAPSRVMALPGPQGPHPGAGAHGGP